MRIFLDDERLPLDNDDSWAIARTLDEFYSLLKEAEVLCDPVTEISFDHDLGAGGEAKHAVQHMIDLELDEPGRHFPELRRVTIHTANTVELHNMAQRFQCAAREGIFPGLEVCKKSALWTRYPIDEDLWQAA